MADNEKHADREIEFSSWALVFQVAAGVTLFGLIFFLIFSKAEKLFD